MTRSVQGIACDWPLPLSCIWLEGADGRANLLVVLDACEPRVGLMPGSRLDRAWLVPGCDSARAISVARW